MGGSQSDVACLFAEDVDWKSRTITYNRKKLQQRGADPATIRFGDEVARIPRHLPQHGPLCPYLRTVRAGDRSTEFKQRCDGLGIQSSLVIERSSTLWPESRPLSVRQGRKELPPWTASFSGLPNSTPAPLKNLT